LVRDLKVPQAKECRQANVLQAKECHQVKEFHPTKECHQVTVLQVKECPQAKVFLQAVCLQVVVPQAECPLMEFHLKEIVLHLQLVICSETIHCSHQSDSVEFRKQWWSKGDKK
jgi:hypothetical protein